MDTPERNRCSTSTPISKFEDSPVFSYLNSLSPIKPVKSLHTFNSLSFAAIPSVFTSPHVKELKFSKRHPSSDHCRSENFPDNENKLGVSEGPEGFTTSPQLSRHHSAAPRESFDQGSSLGETAFEQHNEPPGLEIELSWTKQMDCGSFDAPVCVPTLCNTIGTDVVPQMTDPSASFAPTLQNAPDKGSLQSQVQLQDMFRTDLHWKETENDWNSLISEAAELLIFNSPETHQGLLQKSSGPSTSVTYLPNQCVFPGSYSGQQEIEDPSSWASGLDPIQDSMVNTSPSKFMTNHQKMVIEAGKCMPFTLKPISNLHRGTRRRCLVFDVTGAHIKNINNGSDTGSSDLSQYNQNIASTTHKELVPVTSSCILPGIGLHLNSLPTTSKDHKTAKPDIMATGSQVKSVPLFSRSFPSLLIEQEPSDNALALTSFGRDKDPTEHAFHAAEDISQASGRAMSEQSNPASPKKKRRRLDHATETEACRRCNCKKSKCLKLYCECFAAGVYCVEPCSCQDCFNKPFHEDTVLATRKQIESRNPLAFAPKVIRNSDSIAEIGDEPSKTPASARHKRGCNCKKSSCLKKYCECYQGGVGCSISCRCEGCKNAFGRKDGPTTLEEAEPEETETEAAEKCAVDQCLQKDTIQNKEEQKHDYAPLVAPLQTYRSTSSSLQLALSKRIPLRSSYAIGTTSVLHSSECVGKQNFLLPQPKFEKQFQSAVDDEMPDILRGNNSSPGSGIKVASPNGKRVSPPQCDLGSSPSRRAVRKLLLQSIPSFPSLTQ